MDPGGSAGQARPFIDSHETDACARSGGRIEPGAGIPDDQLRVVSDAAEHERRGSDAGVAEHVSQRFLRDPVQCETRVTRDGQRRVRQVHLDLEPGRALHLFGELREGDGDAGLLDGRRMQPVRQLAQRVGEILHLVPDPVEVAHARGIEAMSRGTELVQLVLHDDEPLDGVVVHLARHAGALLFVRLEKTLRVAPMDGDQPALRDHHRYAEPADENEDGEDGGDEDPPEYLGVRRSSIPHVMAAKDRMTTAARTL
jgi:hypothetical protein